MNRKVVVIIMVILLSSLFLLYNSLLPERERPFNQTTEGILTIQDEMEDRGERIWISRFIFPSLNSGWMFDLQSFGSGPKIESVEQVDAETIKIIGYEGSIEVISQPAKGYRKITIKNNYVPNNFMPGVMAGDVVEQWEEVTHIFSTDIPSLGVFNVKSSDSYGRAKLYRGGRVYEGQGTYDKITASRLFDPSPGFEAQTGWVSNPGFVLLYNEYIERENSIIYWREGGHKGEIMPAVVNPKKEDVDINVETTDCKSFVYTFPTSKGNVRIDITDVKYVVGTPCAFGEAFGKSSSSIGGGGLAWSLVAR